MPEKNITDVVAAIVGVLEPLSSEDRHRVLQASLMLLGERQLVPPSFRAADKEEQPGFVEAGEFPPRVQTWLKQNGVTRDNLDQVFHIKDENVEVIVSEIPGKNTKEKTLNSYILCGTAILLATGDPTFKDKAARALCERYGCYDSGNHSTYLKGKGNELSGSKDKGWTLTGPGLKRAATLVLETGQ